MKARYATPLRFLATNPHALNSPSSSPSPLMISFGLINTHTAARAVFRSRCCRCRRVRGVRGDAGGWHLRPWACPWTWTSWTLTWTWASEYRDPRGRRFVSLPSVASLAPFPSFCLLRGGTEKDLDLSPQRQPASCLPQRRPAPCLWC
jgi:hypothetical protein